MSDAKRLKRYCRLLEANNRTLARHLVSVRCKLSEYQVKLLKAGLIKKATSMVHTTNLELDQAKQLRDLRIEMRGEVK